MWNLFADNFSISGNQIAFRKICYVISCVKKHYRMWLPLNLERIRLETKKTIRVKTTLKYNIFLEIVKLRSVLLLCSIDLALDIRNDCADGRIIWKILKEARSNVYRLYLRLVLMMVKGIETTHLILCYATVLRDPENPRDCDVGSNDGRVICTHWRCIVHIVIQECFRW